MRAAFSVSSRPPGTELADLAVGVGDGIWAIFLSQPVPPLAGTSVSVEIADQQGNVTRVARTFSTLGSAIFADGFESGDTGAWSASSGG